MLKTHERVSDVTIMTFRHFSHPDFVLDPKRYYFNELPDSKPEGLWIDTPSDRDWPYICSCKALRPNRRTEYTVTLSRTANILYLHSIEDLKWFHNRYVNTTRTKPYQYGRLPNKEQYEIINWKDVTREYDGIFITFFDEDFAEYLEWFWAWDLPSGCIWNLSAISSVERTLVKEEVYA